jgi:hypothetical protein
LCPCVATRSIHSFCKLLLFSDAITIPMDLTAEAHNYASADIKKKKKQHYPQNITTRTACTLLGKHAGFHFFFPCYYKKAFIRQTSPKE